MPNVCSFRVPGCDRLVCARDSNNFSAKPNYVLTRNPSRWPLVFSAVGDYAFFAARDELENDLFAPVQAGPFVILGGRED